MYTSFLDIFFKVYLSSRSFLCNKGVKTYLTTFE